MHMFGACFLRLGNTQGYMTKLKQFELYTGFTTTL